MRGRSLLSVATLLFVSASVGIAVTAKDGDKDKPMPNAQEVIVDFGVPGAAGAANHFLVPDEVDVSKGGTVVFRVNGGAHGVSVYAVDKHTSREDIQAGLCPVRTACDATFIAADHIVVDAHGDTVLQTGTNPPFQRVDDAGRVLVATTAQTADGVPGRFHQGVPVSAATPGNEQIRIKFLKKGRYLAICMNRAHSINDWMFGFINVGGDDDDDR
jgi:plastocyanin